MARRELTPAQAERLAAAESLWLATVRPNRTAHLVPVWAVLHDGRIYIGTEPDSQKVRNILAHGSAALSLPDPLNVLIVEGRAAVAASLPDGVMAAFRSKYGWDFTPGERYVVVEVIPEKVLAWEG